MVVSGWECTLRGDCGGGCGSDLVSLSDSGAAGWDSGRLANASGAVKVEIAFSNLL